MAFKGLRAALARYRPAQPAVVLRTAAWHLNADAEQVLSPEAEGQIQAAAAKISQHYGQGVRFQVYVAHSGATIRSQLTAQRLEEVLRPQSNGAPQIFNVTLRVFFEEVVLTPGVVPVIVSNEPSVMFLLIDLQAKDSTARYAEPHFRLKWT